MTTEAEQRESYLKALPEHLAALGDIVRESVQTGDLQRFAEFLLEQQIAIQEGLLEQVRDLVILRRLDLKDLEPAARERLRARVLSTQDPQQATDDYTSEALAGRTPRCLDCHYFATAPCDESSGGDQSCVELGAKGGDEACIGFTKKQG